jgi:Protein of unknown function (DUF3808)
MAMKYAEKLFNESRWSPAIYAYLKASFLLMFDERSEELREHVTSLMRLVELFRDGYFCVSVKGRLNVVQRYVTCKRALRALCCNSTCDSFAERKAPIGRIRRSSNTC